MKDFAPDSSCKQILRIYIFLDELLAYTGKNSFYLATKTGNFIFAKVKFENYESDRVKEVKKDEIKSFSFAQPYKLHGLFQNKQSLEGEYVICIIEREEN